MYIKTPRHRGPGPEEYAILAALILAAAAAVLLYYAAHPLYHDEAMYAEAPREMLLRSGSLITPTLNFAPFLFKPPLYIWSIAASMRLFGDSWLAIRLPGILFSLGSILFTLLIASRLGRAAGLYAAAALATSFGFVFHNSTMLTDHLLVFLVSGSLYFFLRVSEGKPYAMAAVYACLGLAVMTKGLLGLVFPGVAILLYVLTTGRSGLLRKFLDGPGILIFILITVPWHVASEIKNPGFLKSFLVNEQLMRFMNKRYPPDLDEIATPLFLLVNFGWLMPWSAFLLQSVTRPLVRNMTDAERLALCWALGGTAFLCVTSGKLDYYGMPVFPAYAALAGMYWSRLGERRGMEVGATIGAGSIALVTAAAVIGAMFAQDYISSRFGISRMDAVKFCALGIRTLFPLAVGSIAGTVLIYRKRYGWAFIAITLASLLMYVPARHGFALFEPYNTRYHAAMEMARIAGPDDVLVVDGEYEYEFSASYTFYTKRKVLILSNHGMPILPMKVPEKDRFLIEEPEFRALWDSPRRVVFATRRDPANEPIAGIPAESLHKVYEKYDALYTNR